MGTASTSASIVALVGYAAWTLTLLVSIVCHRLVLVLRGQRRANGFSPWGDDVSPVSARLCRAHANCVENLPTFAAIVMAAVLAEAHHVTDPLALWVLAARIAQSIAHLTSTSTTAVTVRFTFMAVQMLVQGKWALELLGELVRMVA